jgi:YD repeat-containing protein
MNNKLNLFRNIKRNKFFLSIFLMIFINNICIAQNSQTDYSQNLKSYTLSTPEVSSFERYSLTNTDNYTGKVNISIPIYTIKSGSIVYPIDLVYNSGGVKVDQLASDVGLGWNITGALITRTINYSNDFDNTGALHMQSDYQTYSNEDQTENNALTFKKCGYFLQKQNPYALISPYFDVDFLPDTYHFLGNGSSTDFFFKDVNTPLENNPKGNKIEAFSSKIRINTQKGNYDYVSNVWTPTYNFLTNDFFTISITSKEGIKYTFSDCDYSFIQFLNGRSETSSPAQISAWHITKIEDLKNGKKIDFIYENTSSNPNHPVNSNLYFNPLVAQRTFGYSVSTNTDPQNPITHYYNSDYQTPIARIDVQKKRLIKIIFDEGEINFNYNNNGVSGQSVIIRDDIYNSDCLTQIYLKDKNLTTIKSFNFNYDYFTSNYNVNEFNPDFTYNPTRYKRLKLLSFGEIGKPLHKFTYDEIIKLPPINSFSIDFLGYFNNSADTQCCSFSDRSPTLYYYENQFEKSLLPFPIASMNPVIIPGYFNRQANEYSKAWSLIKIDNPMGGSTEYVYESNNFEEFGQNVKGGGIRIAQQKLNDGFGSTRIIDYTYTNLSGNTSGKLASIPYFGFPTDGNFNCEISYPTDGLSPATLTTFGNNSNITWQLFDKSNLNAEVTSGSYVGYSRVIEREFGNGRRELNFTSNNNPQYQNSIYRTSLQSLNPIYPQIYFGDLINTLDQGGNEISRADGTQDWVIGNSAVFSNFFTDNSYKRGKITDEKIYNELNQLVKKTSFIYNENLINTFTFNQGSSHIATNAIYVSPYAQDYYEQYLRLNLEAFVTVKKDYKISQFLPTSKTISYFDNSGTQNDIIYNYTYNSNGFLSSEQMTESNNDISLKRIYYSQDPTLSSEPFVNDLITKNVIGTPLKTEEYKNSIKIFEQKTVYAKDVTTSNLLQPKFVYAKKGDDASAVLEKKMTCDLYDDKGNLIQYTLESGIPVSLIWGYNKTKLIAKIENISYSTITSNLITNIQTASNSGTEASLITAINNLRNNSLLAKTLITSYTHKPLIGTSSVTDTRGQIIYFNYDSFGRLINVKDTLGNILKENEYNYKPQF